MKEKKQAIRLILGIIVFTVLLIYFVNHTSVLFVGVRALLALIFPFLLGCGIAFVINIPMTEIEKTLFKNPNRRIYKSKRAISMVISYILAILVVGIVIFVVVPEIADTVTAIKYRMPDFIKELQEWASKYADKYPEIVKQINSIEIDTDKIGDLFKDYGSSVLTSVVKIFSSIIGAVVNTFIGIVFSMYILSQKEHLGRQTKMICYAAFKESTADEMMVFGKIAHNTFNRFFACQFREGLILGSMFAIVMAIFKMPYPLTIGVLIGFTALIPVFGAFVGLFIGCFLILVEAPKMVIWFVVLFFVLQFIENYFIYPRLVGGGIGLSAIWVLLAVLVGGDLMGIVGMFIFIPLVSVIYSYVRSLIRRKLKKKKIDVDAKVVPDDAVPLMEDRRRLFQPKARGKKTSSNYKDFDTVGDLINLLKADGKDKDETENKTDAEAQEKDEK